MPVLVVIPCNPETTAPRLVQNVLLDKILVRLPRNLLNHKGKNHVSEIGIILGRAGNKAKLAAQHQLKKLPVVRRLRKPVILHDAYRREHRVPGPCRKAAPVAQKVLYSNLIVILILDTVAVRSILEDTRRTENRVPQTQPALLLQNHDARCRDKLGHRRHPHDIARAHLLLLLFVRPAEALGVQQRIPAHNSQLGALQLPLAHVTEDFLLHRHKDRCVRHRVGQHLVKVYRRAHRVIGIGTGTRNGTYCHQNRGEQPEQ